MTKWKETGEECCYERHAQFTTPLPLSIGKTTRVIQLHRIRLANENTMIFETSSQSKDVPFSSHFLVESKWIFRNFSKSNCEVKIFIFVNFLKKLWLKPMVEHNAIEGSKDWFVCWVNSSVKYANYFNYFLKSVEKHEKNNYVNNFTFFNENVKLNLVKKCFYEKNQNNNLNNINNINNNNNNNNNSDDDKDINKDINDINGDNKNDENDNLNGDFNSILSNVSKIRKLNFISAKGKFKKTLTSSNNGIFELSRLIQKSNPKIFLILLLILIFLFFIFLILIIYLQLKISNFNENLIFYQEKNNEFSTTAEILQFFNTIQSGDQFHQLEDNFKGKLTEYNEQLFLLVQSLSKLGKFEDSL